MLSIECRLLEAASASIPSGADVEAQSRRSGAWDECRPAMTSVILDRRATMHEMRGLALSTTGAVDVAVAFARVQPLAHTSHGDKPSA